MLIFRSEDHIDRWCALHDLQRGATLTPQQTWQLADNWFRDKLKPEWRRHTLEETEELLARIGLVDSFWNLRMT
jgi:hypothetical protein